jgi:hypothetical protein
MIKRLKTYYAQYRRYLQVDVLMYAVMVIFILVLFLFFG